jgi:plastocyanin
MTVRVASISMVLLLVSCGGDGGGGGARPTSTGGSPSADCVETTDLTAVDNEFEPICVIAASGDELTISNEGSAPHTFTIPDTDVDVTLQPGDQGTATVPDGLEIDAENEFLCTIHPEMVGYLYVTA